MPAKAKKVTITMKSISDTAGGAPDVMELITEGTLRPVTLGKAQGWEISYNDSEATGFAGSVTTVSCIGEELASMTRNGAANARLIIEKDRRHHCHYGTEYGDFMIGVCTDEIRNELEETGGDIYLKYTLDINSSYMSENEMFINVKECN